MSMSQFECSFVKSVISHYWIPNQKVLYSYHDSKPMVNFERTSEHQPLNDAKSQSAL